MHRRQTREKSALIRCVCFFLATGRLRAIIDAHHNTNGARMTDKFLDLLEFIAGIGVFAGFVFLTAYAAVGGI